ncbi:MULTISPECIES: GlsB/YeaQ/YmgE family stress response membrane protein [Bacteria]|uniref:GlsB/YeaQ/YmgE family stress response membrane protein n=1 Tax=Bacteria TaxID=2 RepID=UPI00103B9A3E|nr:MULTISPECIES: GlsB/YeaQ/YmgE family stress response membrane protein [Bacteria]QDM40990.1 GlsB/YeaQ/YmgE family stress response membrane protein [Altererythrobacter sp. TH136]TCJ40201.1 GlsB/YeaQ/YmgE family stress response membrane protein [Parafrankia sp. BMG5.11]
MEGDGVGILTMIIVGGVAGWLASMVMSRDGSMGILLNIVVGIVGGFLGGLLLGGLIPGDGWIHYLITAFIGAVILLLIANLIQRKRVR